MCAHSNKEEVMKFHPYHLACATALVFAATAHAQTKGPGDYASKPVRLVVPFVPGGPTDIQGRMLAEKLGQRLGQQVIVDNRGGANGNIGMEIVARAPADGYNLVIATVGTWAVNPHLYTLPFDVVKDFAPITQVSTSPGVLVVHPTVQAKTVKELIALARAKPGALNYGSSGIGAFGHGPHQRTDPGALQQHDLDRAAREGEPHARARNHRRKTLAGAA